MCNTASRSAKGSRRRVREKVNRGRDVRLKCLNKAAWLGKLPGNAHTQSLWLHLPPMQTLLIWGSANARHDPHYMLRSSHLASIAGSCFSFQSAVWMPIFHLSSYLPPQEKGFPSKSTVIQVKKLTLTCSGFSTEYYQSFLCTQICFVAGKPTRRKGEEHSWLLISWC